MNIRFIKASALPKEVLPESMSEGLENDDRCCAFIPNPSTDFNKLAEKLCEEYGPFSESYLKSFPKRNPKSHGTGSGSKTIRSYVVPYTVNGNVNAIFYTPKIQEIVETKIVELLEETNQNQLK